MTILQDIDTAFRNISIGSNGLTGEEPITKEIAKKIQETTSAAIEVPYYGQYAGNGRRCTSNLGLIRCYSKFCVDSSMPIHIDLSLYGRTTSNQSDNWLIEAKYLGQTTSNMRFGMAYCANQKININCLMYTHPLKTTNSFLTDAYDGVIWADICRLLEAYSYWKTKTTRPRLFQAYYIHKNHKDFGSRLLDIYNLYYNAINGRGYGDYVITKGHYNERHAWKIHEFENINCHTSSIPSPVALIPPCSTPMTPTPLALDKSGNYYLYLIEIIPRK